MAPGRKRRGANAAGPSQGELGEASTSKQVRPDPPQQETADAKERQVPAQVDLETWSAMRLRCSSKTVRDEAALQQFLATLAEAPCLGALELSLGNRASTLPAVCRVLAALPKATADIKELVLTFGDASREAVIALLGRVKDHLEKLTVLPMYQHSVWGSKAALQRFWTALEETGVTSLALPGDCMKLQGSVTVKLRPTKWRLESLSAEFGPGAQRTLLAPLIRANAASLRKVRVAGIALSPTDLKAAFAALADCGKLEDATLPCCRDVLALERCAALSKLDFSAAHLMLVGAAGAEVKAVAKVLALPGVVERVESLTLTMFKFGVTISAAKGLYKSVRGMRNLKKLSVAFCIGFAGELKATLKALPLLEELELVDGDEPSWQSRVLADVTPAIAPALKTLRLHPNLLHNDQRETLHAARDIRQRFDAAGRQLEVLVEAKPKLDRLSDSSDEEDDEDDGPGGPDPGCVLA